MIQTRSAHGRRVGAMEGGNPPEVKIYLGECSNKYLSLLKNISSRVCFFIHSPLRSQENFFSLQRCEYDLLTMSEGAEHYHAPSITLRNLMLGLDEHQHRVVAFVTATESLDFFCVAPFVCVFQFIGDRTVYGIMRIDIAPEFDPVDFVRWFLLNENLCATYCMLEMSEYYAALEQNEHCMFCLSSGDPSSSDWDCLKMYMTVYFTGHGAAFSIPWLD